MVSKMNNPFISSTFVTIWSKHFNNLKQGKVFQSIENVSFINHKWLPYYSNVGLKLTNGISYKLSNKETSDYKNKVFLIRDIPSYLEINAPEKESKLKVKKIQQYQGFLTEVSKFDSLDQYMNDNFKSNSRSKFRRNISRLEASFDVDYIMYHGAITQEEFDYVFACFYKLLEKRYAEKGEPCGELNPVLWNYYCELAFAMIQEKTGSLFVIYCNTKPIGITFSYHFNTTLIEALTVFDIDFYRFNIGHTTIYKMLEWSFNNGITLFDYTQGDFEYKKRWSNTTYDTSFHILYDSSSIVSKIITSGFICYFKLKRNLRDRNFNKAFHNMKHTFFGRTSMPKFLTEAYKVEVLTEPFPNLNDLKAIEINDQLYTALRKSIYDFLYMNPEPAKDLKMYCHKKTNTFYAKGSKNSLKIVADEK